MRRWMCQLLRFVLWKGIGDDWLGGMNERFIVENAISVAKQSSRYIRVMHYFLYTVRNAGFLKNGMPALSDEILIFLNNFSNNFLIFKILFQGFLLSMHEMKTPIIAISLGSPKIVILSSDRSAVRIVCMANQNGVRTA